MITKNFLEIIGKINKRLLEYFNQDSNNFSKKEIILKQTVKISEEVWELSWEVLSSFWLQRKEKLVENWKENLENEFADVILSTLLLAKTMDVDINLALEKKLEKIKERGLL